ncbi:hypothetical protein SAMN06272735_2984 [Streptomyces sp. TLI_55]|uniref:hypothetical protein n=1 Tax=Streptomyces sp. TLI_55 TaxID=1938861 RepID=UPI000BD51BC9|nr:hypothetical protein [Streptomyces sp. TLI_55]SNX58488.1 hypothetical protein SAMN06272735_2984 [Streptomyces sp. TLI_55]
MRVGDEQPRESVRPMNDDELMAVLLGEPPATDGDGYAAAERDMAVAREQLRRIGDGLARQAPSSSPVAREPVPRGRRLRRGMLALAVSVAVALTGTAVAYLVAHNGISEADDVRSKLTAEGVLACAGTIAEGTVDKVDELGGGRFRVVLDVEHRYKPEGGGARLSFVTEGAETKTYYRTGARILVLVPENAAEGPETFREGDPPLPDGGPGAPSGPVRDALDWGRQWVEQALPGSRGVDCPHE